MSDQTPYFAERAFCNECGHMWVAVFPVGTDSSKLEEQLDGETLEPAPLKGIPLKLQFGAKELYLEVLGWKIK